MELPRGERLRRAVRWISAGLGTAEAPQSADSGPGDGDARAPARPDAALIDEACRRFDLTPVESDFLVRFYRDGAALPSED